MLLEFTKLWGMQTQGTQRKFLPTALATVEQFPPISVETGPECVCPSLLGEEQEMKMSCEKQSSHTVSHGDPDKKGQCRDNMHLFLEVPGGKIQNALCLQPVELKAKQSQAVSVSAATCQRGPCVVCRHRWARSLTQLS